MRPGVQAVLFDLDGTLVDSAPDLAGAVNDMRVARALPLLPYERLRPMAGAGARGMLGVGFGITPAAADFEGLKAEFLDRYSQRLLHNTVVFAHVAKVIAALQACHLPWGVVTNKAARFTLPLLAGLPSLAQAQVVISGDTTPYAKPHPAPLLAARDQLGVAVAACVYVGDDLRDMQAAQAAGMRGVAAAWGYLGLGDDVAAWPCEAVCQDGNELLNWLGMA